MRGEKKQVAMGYTRKDEKDQEPFIEGELKFSATTPRVRRFLLRQWVCGDDDSVIRCIIIVA